MSRVRGRGTLFGFALLLVVAAALRGGGTVVVKDAVDQCGFALVVAVRFLLGAALLALVYLPRLRCALTGSTVRRGAVVGVVAGAVFLLNHAGMVFVSPSQSSFLTSTYCIMVPPLGWLVLRERLSCPEAVGALLCLFGLRLVFEGASAPSFTWGALLSLGGALLFAVQLIVTRAMVGDDDAIALSVVQMAVAGLMGVAVAALNGEGVPVGEVEEQMPLLVYIAVFSTLVPLVLQNVALERVSSGVASVLLSTEALFAVMTSVFFWGEVLSGPTMVGFGLIFAAVIVVSWRRRGQGAAET